MYAYNDSERQFIRQRVAEFRDQTRRRLAGELSEDEFKPLRLMNGLYLQLHAYMLRVAIPYGTVNARQLEALAEIAERYDRGYGHFTTRQNIQFNWIKLAEAPDILDRLAEVDMHAIQTSGNCIRNVTCDPLAGAAADEVADPRPVCELIRQWSTLNPEYLFLPRKFKIAVSAGDEDRAAVKAHDIGLRLYRDETGRRGWQVIVGGGQGRTPVIGKVVREFLPEEDLLAYLDAILRVYNLHGRRDNKHKARIKILVNELGIEAFTRQVEAAFTASPEHGARAYYRRELKRIGDMFAGPALRPQPADPPQLVQALHDNRHFARWVETNTAAHRVPGHAIVTVSCKPAGKPPGDVSAAQLRVLARLARRYSGDEARITYQQNVVLAHVPRAALFALWRELKAAGLASANAGLASDIIACPGLDYCTLATARSIPIAEAISARLAGTALEAELGQVRINISGCINACGHHHLADIGILGLEKKGKEFYQIKLGGQAGDEATIGEVVGRGFAGGEVAGVIETILRVFVRHRRTGETFNHTLRRIGAAPFKEAIYAAA